MHREPLLQLLHAYSPSNEVELAGRLRMIRFVAENPQCFQRECAAGHVTGSAWLTNATGDAVLLTLHRKLGKWLQLGGHCDGDADTLRVALREACEESGIEDLEAVTSSIFDVDVHDIPPYRDEPAHVHYDVRYWIRTRSSDRFSASGESKELRWFQRTELSTALVDESVSRMARKWLEASSARSTG